MSTLVKPVLNPSWTLSFQHSKVLNQTALYGTKRDRPSRDWKSYYITYLIRSNLRKESANRKRIFDIRNYNTRRGFEKFCEWPERLLLQEEKAPRRQCACSSPAHAHWMWFPPRHSCLSHCNSSATIPRLLPLPPLQTAPDPPSPKQFPLLQKFSSS